MAGRAGRPAPLTLVILAAGIARRYGGGLKQLAPIGPHGEAAMDLNVRAAADAGFSRAVVIVRAAIADAIAAHVAAAAWPQGSPAAYVVQDADPRAAGRAKPPGTGHAVLCCRDLVDSPFAVVNADDVYGAAAFVALGDHLRAGRGECLVGFPILRTIVGAGPVTRGLCSFDTAGLLLRIEEGTVHEGVWEGNGRRQRLVPGGDELASMNCWGFTRAVFDILARAMDDFVAAGRLEDPDAELLLPTVIGDAVAAGELDMTVLRTEASCLGVTHPEDLALVQAALA